MRMTTLDVKKYKRFFAFGCSFTNYIWPTWADIIGQDIEYYENWGVMGAGNQFIFNSVIEANQRYNFTDTDLIMIMWSIIDREDRYIENKWLVTTQLKQDKIYEKCLEKFSLDIRGSLIRDLAFIRSTQIVLENLSCDWAHLLLKPLASANDKLLSVGLKEFNKKHLWKYSPTLTNVCIDLHNGIVHPDLMNVDVLTLYKDVFINMCLPISTVVLEHSKTPLVRSNNNDLHPTPMEALEYIDKLFPNNLSNNARIYGNQWDKINKSIIRL